MLERREPTAVGVDGCGARSHGTIPKGKRRAGTLAIQRFDYVLSVWKDLAGGEVVEFSNATYLSERATANRNRALAHLLVRAWGFYSQRRRRRPQAVRTLTRARALYTQGAPSPPGRHVTARAPRDRQGAPSPPGRPPARTVYPL